MNTSEICKLYLKIKAYQYMLYQFLNNNGTTVTAILKPTIKSILYLLQNIGESLQAIQVSITRIFFYVCIYVYV